MRLSVAPALVALGVVLSGCATIIDGSSEKIGITTGSVTGAHCVLSNGRGQWSVVTPGKVTVERSKHDIKVTCSKPGYQDVAQTIPSDIDDWTLVNFAFADLPGLGVDAATGAINDYDDTTTVHMSQGGYGAEPSYPSYPSQPNYPPVQQQMAPQTPPPAYLDNSPYPAPTQPYSDQSQDQSYPDQSYQDQSQQPYPDQQQSYPDNSQGGGQAGSLPPL